MYARTPPCRPDGPSNIIFSNGLLDPWHGGGFLPTPLPDGANRTAAASGGRSDDGRSVHKLTMARGAHHLDLRGPDPADPPEVTATRAEEERIIASWIDAYVAARAPARAEEL